MELEDVSSDLDSASRSVLVAPTGWGKTRLLHDLALATVASDRHVAYVTAYRSAAQEMASRWQQSAPGSVSLHTSDQIRPDNLVPLRVTVPEKLDAWTLAGAKPEHASWMQKLSLVIIDEAHVLGQAGRGPTLEMALARLRQRHPEIRLVLASATLTNLNEIARWLDARPILVDEQPRLEWHYDVSADAHEVHVLDLAARQPSRLIVFRNTRLAAEGTAHRLQMNGHGAAAHHAGLSHQQRSLLERQFADGSLPIIVATSTLGAGVNLNPLTILIGDERNPDGSWRSVAEVQQSAGRTGRRIDRVGQVLVARREEDADRPHWESLLAEPIRSGLADRNVHVGHLMRQACLDARTPLEVHQIFDQTLAARQGLLPTVGTSFERFGERGLLELDRSGPDRVPVHWTATTLGQAAARQNLTLVDLELLSPLDDERSWSCFDVLLHLLALHPAPQRRISTRLLQALAPELGQFPSLLLDKSLADASLLPIGRLPLRNQASLLRAAACLILSVPAWGLTRTDLSRLHQHVTRMAYFMNRQPTFARAHGRTLAAIVRPTLPPPVACADPSRPLVNPTYVNDLIENLFKEEFS